MALEDILGDSPPGQRGQIPIWVWLLGGGILLFLLLRQRQASYGPGGVYVIGGGSGGGGGGGGGGSPCPDWCQPYLLQRSDWMPTVIPPECQPCLPPQPPKQPPPEEGCPYWCATAVAPYLDWRCLATDCWQTHSRTKPLPYAGCPLDIVCWDGSLPQGPDCVCPPPPGPGGDPCACCWNPRLGCPCSAKCAEPDILPGEGMGPAPLPSWQPVPGLVGSVKQ